MRTEFIDRIDSTNAELLRRGNEGQMDDCCLVSFEQTAGRGRRGRTFESPRNSGIYMSMLLHPGCNVEKASLLTTMMAVAACEALEGYDTGVIDIKWVNDLYLNNRKVAGILTECSPQIENGIPAYVVVGIGVNIYPPEKGFSSEIKDRAGWLFESSDSVKINEVLRNMAISIRKRFEGYYERFPRITWLTEYRKRSFLIGRRVKASDGTELTVTGIDDDFGLLGVSLTGLECKYTTGEVSLQL